MGSKFDCQTLLYLKVVSKSTKLDAFVIYVGRTKDLATVLKI